MNKMTVAQYHARHEQKLKGFIDALTIPAPKIKDAIHYSLFPGGKRLRPMLVYLCGALVHVDINTLDAIAAAIELTHCYSLIHDDLPAMDDDNYRRNKPSLHRAFDEATAILVGDGLQALAIELLTNQLPLTLPATRIIPIIQHLTNAAGIHGMVSGQSLDLSELSTGHITEATLREIHALKTGALFSACINMVLAASEAPQKTRQTLENVAKHLGLVFQMQDDYLDAHGDANTLGKQRASDAANNKTTFATLYNHDALLKQIEKQYQIMEHLLEDNIQSHPELNLLINTLKQRTPPINK